MWPGMVAGLFLPAQRLIFQSVSEIISLQLEEELEHEVWDPLESLSFESDTVNHNTWNDVTLGTEFKQIWETKNWVVWTQLPLRVGLVMCRATHVLASRVLVSHY